MSLTGTRLASFANIVAASSASGSGFLKPWKADSMVATFARMPQIFEDRARLGKYVTGCLSMEGFSAASCDEIAEFIFNAAETSE